MSDDAAVPAVRASDAERDALVVRLQAAVGEGRLDLDEFAQRAESAYAAVTTAELERLVDDLPVPTEIVGSRAPQTLRDVFGDVRLAGPGLPPRQISSVFGDLRLRSLAPGESASRWRAVLDRLDRGRGGPAR
ncbi:DUF1707 SHOCT-like domain-containing protein [Blastococcus atacamensis]|uniref:DUF1707 SHOCT-like domain-containing protein n=1 Tax=Blastococcus atacamensis TaxID=2070508 RepID=UPI000CEBA343|nr:DUF1707 domain-containing protein [Blastococcus atacamensis]